MRVGILFSESNEHSTWGRPAIVNSTCGRPIGSHAKHFPEKRDHSWCHDEVVREAKKTFC